MVWKTKHDKNSLVERVQFVTAAPDPVREFTVVTNLDNSPLKDGKTELDNISPYTTLKEVRENTGWEIIQREVPLFPVPIPAEPCNGIL